MQPLADRIRPTDIAHVCGQKHILGEGMPLRNIIEGGKIPNMIFYGPSGIGKTTVAGIIAAKTNKRLHKLNGTMASTKDIKEIVDELDTMMAPNGVLLYLDEIQYFNKRQQQSLLQYMENGKITLIASTTENPYFYVYSAILSRATVFEFKPIAAQKIIPVIERGMQVLSEENGIQIECAPEVKEKIAVGCGGDARKALNATENCFLASPKENGVCVITLETAGALAQKSAMRYDKDGDEHYDIVSAYQKSMRGSDANAALHYLARLLEAAREELAPKELGELISVLTKAERENMDRMQEDISWFIKKFDYRYEKESWGNSKDAVERTVNKLRSWCVGKEPNPEDQ